jgi:hypothetical protein
MVAAGATVLEETLARRLPLQQSSIANGRFSATDMAG